MVKCDISFHIEIEIEAFDHSIFIARIIWTEPNCCYVAVCCQYCCRAFTQSNVSIHSFGTFALMRCRCHHWTLLRPQSKGAGQFTFTDNVFEDTIIRFSMPFSNIRIGPFGLCFIVTQTRWQRFQSESTCTCKVSTTYGRHIFRQPIGAINKFLLPSLLLLLLLLLLSQSFSSMSCSHCHFFVYLRRQVARHKCNQTLVPILGSLDLSSAS